MQKFSYFPCPICQDKIFIVGYTKNGKKMGSCGHTWKFKKTRSQKEMDRKYVSTPDGGLERIK